MTNIDMIGFRGFPYIGPGLELGTCRAHKGCLAPFVRAAERLCPNHRVVTQTLAARSDFQPFLEHGFPAVGLMDTNCDEYPHYHRKTDELANGEFDVEVAMKALSVAAAALSAIDSGKEPLPVCTLSSEEIVRMQDADIAAEMAILDDQPLMVDFDDPSAAVGTNECQWCGRGSKSTRRIRRAVVSECWQAAVMAVEDEARMKSRALAGEWCCMQLDAAKGDVRLVQCGVAAVATVGQLLAVSYSDSRLAVVARASPAAGRPMAAEWITAAAKVATASGGTQTSPLPEAEVACASYVIIDHSSFKLCDEVIAAAFAYLRHAGLLNDDDDSDCAFTWDNFDTF